MLSRVITRLNDILAHLSLVHTGDKIDRAVDEIDRAVDFVTSVYERSTESTESQVPEYLLIIDYRDCYLFLN